MKTPLEIYNYFRFHPEAKAVVDDNDQRIYQPVWRSLMFSMFLDGYTETDPDLSYARFVSHTWLD